jgi:hypothetical protein
MITLENIKKTALYSHQDRMLARYFLYERVAPKANPNKLWLEFGVHTGQTINYLSRFAQIMYGFDSWEGLPEDWQPGFEKGTFSTGGVMPDVEKNVVLIKGMFEDTLPYFLRTTPGQVGLLHIDCDLYSSTKTVLNLLRDRLAHGTVIIFDELVNYNGYENHEFKALNELQQEICGQCILTPIGRTNYEQVAFMLIDQQESREAYYNLLYAE